MLFWTTVFQQALLADDGERGFGAWGSTFGRHPGTITAAPVVSGFELLSRKL